MSTLAQPTKLHKSAHALSACRALPNGGCRQYTATTFPQDPWQGCERMVRTGQKLGLLKDSHTIDCPYAVLDVLNKNGDIVQDFAIPTAAAFQWFKRKLNLSVESED